VVLIQQHMTLLGCAINETTTTCSCSFTETVLDCEAAANASATATSFTYHDKTCKGWAHQCCLRFDAVWRPKIQKGHVSGKVTPAENIFKASLDKAQVKQLRVNGVRAPRARYPNANPETQQFPIGWNTDPSNWTRSNPTGPALYVAVNNSLIASRNTSDKVIYSGMTRKLLLLAIVLCPTRRCRLRTCESTSQRDLGGIGGPCAVFDPPFR